MLVVLSNAGPGWDDDMFGVAGVVASIEEFQAFTVANAKGAKFYPTTRLELEDMFDDMTMIPYRGVIVDHLVAENGTVFLAIDPTATKR